MAKPAGYWTKKRCIEEALKYDSRVEFERGNASACVISRRNGWMVECCVHMVKLGSRYKRMIYAFEFPDHSVYVGLTFNSKQRMIAHLSDPKSQVYKHKQKTELQPIYKELTGYLNKDVASIREGEFVNKYKSDGWIILNKIKTGGLGGDTIKWTRKLCNEEAKKYTYRSLFKKYSGGAFNAARQKGWLDIICKHMKRPIIWNKFWTKKKCLNEFLKHNNKSNFRKNAINAYNAASVNDWLEEIYNINFLKKR